MPRHKRKQTVESSQINVDDIVKAIRDVKEKKKSERAAAAAYGVKKNTLNRYKKKIDMAFPNFDEATDEQIAKVIEPSIGYASQMVRSFLFLIDFCLFNLILVYFFLDRFSLQLKKMN